MNTPTRVTVSAILDRFERDYLPTLSPRTRKDYARHVQHLKREFGHMIADDLRPKDFGPFLDVPKGKIQRNRQLAVLSCAFSEAVGRWYWIERNVLKDVRRNPSQPRSRYVTDAEFEACKAIAPLRVRLAMDLALLTGQRQGDIITMTWAQVQDIGIVVEQAKTGKKLAIEITPALEAVLDKCWMIKGGGNEGSDHVLPTRTGKPYTSEGFRACWQRTINAYVRSGGKRFTFHDLRAKSASDSETIDAAYQRLGHTSMSMTRRAYDRGVRKVKPLR
jgi:integrase